MQHVVHVAHEAHKAFDPERDGGAIVLTICLAPLYWLFLGRVGSGVLAAMTIADRRRKG
jgi:hypothetical protein